MANEYDERMQQLREEDDAANYSQKYIYKDVPPEDNPAAADLEHRLSEKVTSFTSPLTTNADLLASQDYLTRIVVVGPDGLNRVFLKNNKTGETYAVTGHPKYAPTKEEEADAAFFRKQRAGFPSLAEVDAMMEESVQELVEEEGMSLAEAMEAARREQEGPKKLSPGKAKFKAGERTTHFADWETEGMTEEELKQIGAHPSQLETLPAIEVEQTRERFEEPKQEPRLTDEQRELARRAMESDVNEDWEETDWEETDIEEGDTGAWDSDEQEAFEPFEKIEAPDVRLKPFKRPKPITHKER